MAENKGLFILIAGANASGKSEIIKPKHILGRAQHYANPDILISYDTATVISLRYATCPEQAAPPHKNIHQKLNMRREPFIGLWLNKNRIYFRTQ